MCNPIQRNWIAFIKGGYAALSARPGAARLDQGWKGIYRVSFMAAQSAFLIGVRLGVLGWV